MGAKDRLELPDHLSGGFGILNPDELARRIDEAEAMSTPFQNGAMLLQLLNLWYDVRHFVTQVSGHYGHGDAPVFLATVADWSHNARAFTHPPTGVHVIVFYDRLFDFIADLSLLLPLAVLPPDVTIPDIALFPSLAADLLDRHADAPPAAARRCLQRFKEHHYENNYTSTFEQSAFSESVRLIGQDIELSMQAFVMGHEIAHILCSHEGERKNWQLSAADDEVDAVPLSENVQSWDQEYEADYTGFKLGRGITIGMQIPLATYAWSVLLFFRANEWLMQLHGWRDEPFGSPAEDERFREFGTHPPFSVRREWISKIAESDPLDTGPARLDMRLLEKLSGLL